MADKRISESDLILPSLYLMDIREGSITTSELIKSLTAAFNPQGKDAEILSNRKDTYFSQKVRNLKSHDTLQKLNYATYNDGEFNITNEGRAFLNDRKDAISYLFNNGFAYTDIRDNVGVVYRTKSSNLKIFSEYVEEGAVSTVVHKARVRSQKLRLYAIEHFSHNGIISCDCCGFEFKSFYGPVFGKDNCIEIHHLKPIFQYSGNSEKKTIDEALQNLLPVCPNCHRVIHKQKISSDKIPLFKASIKQTYA